MIQLSCVVSITPRIGRKNFNKEMRARTGDGIVVTASNKKARNLSTSACKFGGPMTIWLIWEQSMLMIESRDDIVSSMMLMENGNSYPYLLKLSC